MSYLVTHATPEQPDPISWLEAERRQPGTARVAFREQLADIDRLLVESATIVADYIKPGTTAFLEADKHAAQEASAALRIADGHCEQLEEACYVVLARQSPVAVDLRHVVSVLRSSADVLRSSNLLRHVVESLTWVHPPSMPRSLRDTIGQFGDVAAQIFDGAIKAWEDHDPLAGNELSERDDEADLLQKYLLTELYTGDQSVEEAVSLALIARYYERIADHGVAMAHNVAYFLTGERAS